MKKPKTKTVRFSRIYFLGLFFLFFALNIFLKLYSLQIDQYSSFKALANNQHSAFLDLVPKRGEIFLVDRNEAYPVAVNKDTKMAYAVPKEIDDPKRSAELISQVLDMPHEDLEEKFSNPEDMYEVLKHRLTDEEIQKINDLKLAGVHLTEESYRYYPAGELASHVLGFVGWKGNDFGGRYGVEFEFEDRLRGEAGTLFQKKDTSGRWISTGEKEIAHAKDGDSFVLTIDHVIQYETEKILKSAVEKFEADRGTIIVMEPMTGKILSMASFPNFNPNDYKDIENMESFRNLAVSDSYECGSVFKTFTIASAIDDGKINPDTTYVDTGQVSEAGYTIKNSDLKSNGKQTMTQVLEKSLNTGVIFAEKLLGNKNFKEYIERFGFGSSTKVDLPGESAANISNLKNVKSDIQFFTASFGQGITVTPIQLVSAYNVIAGGGVLMKPQIVEKIVRSDGSEEKIEPQEERRVVSQKTAQLVSEMLRSVVVNGHGKRADVPGYLVAGKTGTAQVAKVGSIGYEDGKNIGSFAGFAPLNDPRYTILVRLDGPKNVEWAESSAAPAFGELMKFLLEYGGVEPTEKYTQKDLDLFEATHNLSENFIKKDSEDKNEGEEINNKKKERKNISN